MISALSCIEINHLRVASGIVTYAIIAWVPWVSAPTSAVDGLYESYGETVWTPNRVGCVIGPTRLCSHSTLPVMDLNIFRTTLRRGFEGSIWFTDLRRLLREREEWPRIATEPSHERTSRKEGRWTV